MKRLNKYMMLFVAALALVSCVDDVVETPSTEAKAGDEVQFSLTLPSSRTVYGGETTVDGKNVFPIYWVDGDMVQIFSPQCLEGRRSAEYKVSVSGTAQNYADKLTKTGAYGVQWGNNATANFYSLYPSGAYTLSSDGTKAEGVKINYSQNITVNSDGSVTSDMEDCLLYAKKTGVASGEVVNLHYDPISTVIYVTVKVAANATGTDADTFTIQSVSLIADTDIAGTFNLDIANGTFGAFTAGASSKTVQAQITNPSTGGYHTISNDESFSIPLFIAPQTGLNVKNWKIQVVANGNAYTKTLGIDKVLTPGQIHKITLPELKPATTEWEVSKWMTYIPRNVYLSEVSIPGSWNSINEEFQTMGTNDATTIANQYAKGVRAFHLDTRWKAKYTLSFFNGVIGLGVADGGGTGDKYNKYVETSSNEKYMSDSDNPLVEDIISQLVGYIKGTPQEYMILVCSFAQGSAENNGANGWIKEISSICAKEAYKDYILIGQNISSKTLVGDALGKIVVLIASDVAITKDTTPSSTLAENSSCLFSYLPMELKSTMFGDNADNEDQLWYTTTTTNDSGITLYNSQAQMTSSTDSAITDHNRGYVPSHTQREAVLNNILKWSKANYGKDDYAHDKWIYLGLGGGEVASGGNTGITSGSYATIASIYNNWIDGKVTEMGTTPEGQTEVVPYYPVGIVMMNNVESYADTVKDILMLNNKYRLQFDASKPTDYNPNAKARSAYDGTFNTGGNAY